MTHFRPHDTLYRLAVGVVSFAITLWIWPVSTGLSAIGVAMAWILRKHPRGPAFAVGLQAMLLVACSWQGIERTVLLGTLPTLWIWAREERPFSGFGTRTDPERRWSTGFDLVLVGAVEKFVIADSFAPYADRLLWTAGPLTAMESWTGIVAVTVQWVFVIAGLLHLGAGLSTWLGLSSVGTPERPTHARTVGQFMARLHPSLAVHVGPRGILAAFTLALAAGELGAATAIALLTGVSRLQHGRWLTLPAIGVASVLMRGPELARLAFIADGSIGWFGVGSMSFALPIGIALLALGPPRTRRLTGVVRGLLLALVLAFASNSRLLL